MAADALPLLETNLAALSPLTRRAIESAADSDAVQIHAGERPSASLRTADGRWVRLHSGRDPVTEAERFVESALGAVPGGAPSVVIVIGPGLGYAIEALERRAPDTNIIGIEPFPAMAHAMLARRDWQQRLESGRLMLLVGPRYLGAGDIGRQLDERAAASAAVVEHPVMQREYPEAIGDAREAVRQLLQGAKLNAKARRQFAGRYLLNTLANTAAIAAEGDVTALRDLFAGVPAVVVAAGPSLDAQLEQLKALEDRVVIIAVDTALRPLYAAGITPHLVVAVDPSDLNARHLLDLEDTDGTWLVTEGSIDARVPSEFTGRVFFFKVSDHQPWPWLRVHGVDRGVLRAWGSVLTTAFDLALFTGAEPIAFAGADLAFTGGLHYCRGTMNENPATYEADADVRAEGFAKALREHKRQTCPARDVSGQPITSTPQFVQFRDWLIARASEAAPRTVINATGAGILHGGGIVQGDLSMLLSSSALGENTIADRLTSAWRSNEAHREQHAAALRSAATAMPAQLPLAGWREFTATTVSDAAIHRALAATWDEPPVATHQPRSVEWIPGQDARLFASASGGPLPSVQWQVSRDQGASWADIPGANSRAYELTMRDEHRGWLFRACFANPHGTVATEAAVIGVPRLSSAVHDFNGDGKPDVLWRNLDTGSNVVWFMDGTVRSGIGVLIPVPLDGYTLAAAGDLSGIGTRDVVWRQTDGPGLSLWQMESIDGAKGYGPLHAEVGAAWQLVATGDFDGDGKADLLWCNADTGEHLIWFMDGRTRVGVTSLDVGRDPGWTIIGAGDFDGDGAVDLLWRDTTSGTLRIWFMDGLAHRETVVLSRHREAAWSLVGVGDFDADGKADVVWRHAHTGDIVVWFMDGGRITAERGITVAATCDWVVAPDAVRRSPL